MDRAAALEIVQWPLIAFGAAPYVLAVVWIIIEDFILPARIPREEIERLADEMTARCPDNPERAAFIEEEAAWFRSESVEQGKWRRVRKELRKRLGAPFALAVGQERDRRPATSLGRWRPPVSQGSGRS